VPESPPPPVVVRDLTRRFGDFTAVDGVSFEVRTGEIFGFLGPNGAGKTTTIKMLTGLLAPTDGAGWVAGHDIRRERAEIKRRIGYMSQKFSLYTDLTVRENIELFAGLYGVTGTRFEERRAWILDMSELSGAEDRTRFAVRLLSRTAVPFWIGLDLPTGSRLGLEEGLYSPRYGVTHPTTVVTAILPPAERSRALTGLWSPESLILCPGCSACSVFLV